MNKTEFLKDLRNGLKGLPKKEIEERVNFYGEMIDDRTEEGMPEERAVAGLGNISDIIDNILSEVTIGKLVKEKIRPKRRLKAWEIVLIVLGAPLWAPLLAAAWVVFIALYIVALAVVISLWAVDLAVAIASVGGLALTVLYFFEGFFVPGLAALSACLLCMGLTILLYYLCILSSKGLWKLILKLPMAIKRVFVGKESAK